MYAKTLAICLSKMGILFNLHEHQQPAGFSRNEKVTYGAQLFVLGCLKVNSFVIRSASTYMIARMNGSKWHKAIIH